MNRLEALHWLDKEMEYANDKRGTRRVEDNANLAHSPHQPLLSIYWRDAEMYVQRAGVLGLDNELGRQALGKGVAVMIAMLIGTTEEYGPLPKAGIPSGHAEE